MDQTPFGATVRYDEELDCDVVTLQYRSQKSHEHDLTVDVAPALGSNMFRFCYGDHDLIHCDKATLRRRGFTGTFVLWPFPNRILGKKYTFEGQNYSLEQVIRPEGNSVLVHGLVFDREWSYDEPLVNDESAQLTTYISITPEGPLYDAYPFESSLALTYYLSAQGIEVRYEVKNKGRATLPFGFALHPYFSTLGDPDSTLVMMSAISVMEADDDLLPTGRILDVTRVMYRMFDLREPVTVSSLKLDHVYTHLDPSHAASIVYPTHNLRVDLTASDDFTHLVIFTLGGRDFLCLENQTCSTDAVNLHDRGLSDIAHLLTVRPNDTASGSIRYTVFRDL